MKLTLVHRILSVVLSFVVLFSTLSFTVEKHYCGDNLVDTAIFSNAQKCGGMDIDEENYVTKSCCKDTVDVIKGQDELNTADLQKINSDLEFVIVAYLYSYSQLFDSLPKQIIPHKDYSPPNLVRDIQLLDNTFLI